MQQPLREGVRVLFVQLELFYTGGGGIYGLLQARHAQIIYLRINVYSTPNP
jgi:hypothetical protein